MSDLLRELIRAGKQDQRFAVADAELPAQLTVQTSEQPDLDDVIFSQDARRMHANQSIDELSENKPYVNKNVLEFLKGSWK